MSRIFKVSFASVYPHYVTKVEKKGRTKAELDQVIQWLTGFDESALSGHLEAGTTIEDFFADASLNPNAPLITGVVCGVRVEDIEDPLMQKIRYLDKLVDELAKGKSLRTSIRQYRRIDPLSSERFGEMTLRLGRDGGSTWRVLACRNEVPATSGHVQRFDALER